jgi:pantothenate kinase
MTQTQQVVTADLLAGDAIALVEVLIDRIRAVKGDDWVAHIPMDGFHLADAQLDRIGARARKGAPDTFDAAGYAYLLERVKREIDRPVYVPGFDEARAWVATTDQRNAELVASTVDKADRVIVNGAARWGLG